MATTAKELSLTQVPEKVIHFGARKGTHIIKQNTRETFTAVTDTKGKVQVLINAMAIFAKVDFDAEVSVVPSSCPRLQT